MEIAKVTSKGQVTIPKAVRDDLGLETGDKVVWVKSGSDWRVSRPTPLRSFPPEVYAESDRLKSKFIAEASAKYGLDEEKIRRMARENTASQLLDQIRDLMSANDDIDAWESDEDVAEYVFKERYEQRP